MEKCASLISLLAVEMPRYKFSVRMFFIESKKTKFPSRIHDNEINLPQGRTNMIWPSRTSPSIRGRWITQSNSPKDFKNFYLESETIQNRFLIHAQIFSRLQTIFFVDDLNCWTLIAIEEKIWSAFESFTILKSCHWSSANVQTKKPFDIPSAATESFWCLKFQPEKNLFHVNSHLVSVSNFFLLFFARELIEHFMLKCCSWVSSDVL